MTIFIPPLPPLPLPPHTSMFICSGNPYIHCGVNDFTIRHYAGDVRYESTNFLTKNKDTLFDDLILVMKSSKCGFARDHGKLGYVMIYHVYVTSCYGMR